MLTFALAGSAFFMGVVGCVHCAAMCVAPCAAASGGGRAGAVAFQGGRLLSYAAGGAFAAASVGGLLRWEMASGALRPLWLLVQLAALMFGLFLAWRAEPPRWATRRWTARAPTASVVPVGALAGGGVAFTPARTTGAGLAGLAWLAWPCGLLQSALTVAALANGPWQGAAVMAAFALGSAPGLIAGPWLLTRLGGADRGGAAGGSGVRIATRLSGVMLVAGALWALGHGLWAQLRAYCG